MAYEVTATRRRPSRFEDLVGQEFVVSTLQNAIKAGNIAHAYLFSGPRGCGKTSSARIMARALNCLTGPAATPCGICDACQSISKGSTLDVIEIDGASNTSVNDVRQIKEEVQFPPNSYRYKIYIIDEVHMLSTSAFNALLKTIEEPPPWVIFIFATTELHKVPATIKSRCQQFNFRLVPIETLKTVLADAASESGISAEDEALYWIAREANGSVRDAYTLLDQVSAFSSGALTYAKIRDTLGLAGLERLNEIAEACAGGDARAALDNLEAVLASGVSIEQLVIDFASYFRSLLLIQSGINSPALLSQSAERYSQAVRNTWKNEQLERALSIFLQLYRDIRYSLEPRYELELALSRLSWLGEFVSNAEMRSAIEGTRALLTGAKTGGAGPFDRADPAGVPSAPATVRDSRNPAVSATVRDSRNPAVSATVRDSRNPAASVVHTGQDATVSAQPFAALRSRWQPVGTAGTSTAPVGEPAESQPKASSADPEPAACGSTAVEPPVASCAGEDSVGSVHSRQDSQDPASQVSAQQVSAPQVSVVAFSDLKEAMVRYFQSRQSMIASALSQSDHWQEQDDCIQLTVQTPLLHTLLQRESRDIGIVCSQMRGGSRRIKILLQEPVVGIDQKKSDSPPRTVELLQHLFRGAVTGSKT